ncbi:hypothetical protein EJMLMN_EJMLMN_17275, partial [Dysosmobacter welbionis]
LRPRQLPAVVPEQPPLDAQGLHPKCRPAQKYKEPVDRRQLDVDGGRRQLRLQQGGLPGPRRRLGRRPAV